MLVALIFFWHYIPASAGHSPSPPLEIIIMVCHEKGRHPLPPNRYVLFERPLLLFLVSQLCFKVY